VLNNVFAVVLLACAATQAATNLTGVIGPRLSERELFAMLDLDRPDLKSVQLAVAQNDWLAARHELAEHLRHRPMPRWGLDPMAVGRDPQYRESEAENALAHRLTSLGVQWQFGARIDWSFNPTTQPGSKWAANHEWTWQLSRHHFWMALAHCYYATGDERYAREFVAELRSWLEDCPVPDTVQNKPFSRWRTIEAGIRTGSIWPEVFPRFLAAKAFDDESLLMMARSFVEHAQYLMKFHMQGNWLTMEANGLYHVGALFPEFQAAAHWRETAAGRLEHELDAQVYPDGAQIELAPGYHIVALDNFLGPVRLIPQTGFELPPAYLPKIERMYNYLLYSMRPDHRTPPLNDSGAVSVTRPLEEGARLFPQRTDFLWAASEGSRGRAPAQLSCVFPYAGQFVMRSDWGPDALWLCMDGGPFGFGHQHEDKLSVMLNAFGRPLLVEAGTYTYDASEWRRYALSSRAHNVVLVDGLEQNRRRKSRESFVVKTPLPQVWESNPEFDHAAARYDEGYGPEGKSLAIHTRHVFYLKPDLFLIADQFEPRDERSHTYEALFHLDSSRANIQGLEVVTANSGPNLALKAFGADSVALVTGQTNPVVQGWLPDSSRGYGGIRPIPTAIFKTTASSNTAVLYALFPSTNAAPCPVTAARIQQDTLTVSFSHRAQRSIRFRPLNPDDLK